VVFAIELRFGLILSTNLSNNAVLFPPAIEAELSKRHRIYLKKAFRRSVILHHSGEAAALDEGVG